MSRTPTLSFVCCIESGPLEFQTIRLVRSIRHWGGRYAQAPILAVTPRSGCPLHPDTHRQLEENGVRHIRRNVEDTFSWFGYLNKAKALEIAETEVDTDQIVWLDSDILMIAQPDDLVLEPGIDVAACPTSKTAVGTCGPDDANEDYWRKLCELAELTPDDLGWTTTVDTNERIRAYFNSGVISYRRGMNFGAHYRELCQRILARGPSHPLAGTFYVDQLALSLLLRKADYAWRELNRYHNLTMRPELECTEDGVLAATALIHYRGSMWPEHWNQFLGTIEAERADVAMWLRGFGPMHNRTRTSWRLVNKLLRLWRARRWQRWEASRVSGSTRAAL